MTLQTLPTHFIWPHPLLAESVSLGTTAGTITFDATNDKLAWVGQAVVTDAVKKVTFRTGTLTTGCTMEIRIETVGADGKPTGTLWGANTNGTVAVSAATTQYTVTLTSNASVNKGDIFAIVLQYNSGSIPNFTVTIQPTSMTGSDSPHFPNKVFSNGGAAYGTIAATSYQMFVEYNTNGIMRHPGLSPFVGGPPLNNVTSASNPNEYALRFQVPFKCRCNGAYVALANISAGADYTVSLWPASSSVIGDALATIAMDGDLTETTTRDGYMFVVWASPVILLPNTTYYLGWRADTANNAAPILFTVGAAGDMAAAPGGVQCYQSARNWSGGTAGAWTDTTTSLPAYGIAIDQLDDGTGNNVIGGGVG